jgi:hypothetical protein
MGNEHGYAQTHEQPSPDGRSHTHGTANEAGYPAIGSGCRSRTGKPVNVEPVVPVISTVR